MTELFSFKDKNFLYKVVREEKEVSLVRYVVKKSTGLIYKERISYFMLEAIICAFGSGEDKRASDIRALLEKNEV